MGKRKKHKKPQLQKKFKKDPHFKNMKIIESSDEEKMSGVILRFIEPYKSSATTIERFEKLVVLAMVAWNAHILKDKNIIAKLKESNEEEWGEELDQVLAELMIRKEQLFPDNKRLILDYRITETSNEFNLQVVSTPGQ